MNEQVYESFLVFFLFFERDFIWRAKKENVSFVRLFVCLFVCRSCLKMIPSMYPLQIFKFFLFFSGEERFHGERLFRSRRRTILFGTG